MEDADLQFVFAHMASGNFVAASTAIDGLPSSYSDWKNLLDKILELQQDTTEGIYKLNTDTEDRLFFLHYSASDTLDGKTVAQAILKEACDSSYKEPHALPEGESARPENVTGLSKLLDHEQNDFIEVFPNPSQNGVYVRYNSASEEKVKIELKDLLGRDIYFNFIDNSKSDQLYIPFKEISNGVYLITVTRKQQLIYRTKIVKQD